MDNPTYWSARDYHPLIKPTIPSIGQPRQSLLLLNQNQSLLLCESNNLMYGSPLTCQHSSPPLSLLDQTVELFPRHAVLLHKVPHQRLLVLEPCPAHEAPLWPVRRVADHVLPEAGGVGELPPAHRAALAEPDVRPAGGTVKTRRGAVALRRNVSVRVFRQKGTKVQATHHSLSATDGTLCLYLHSSSGV